VYCPQCMAEYKDGVFECSDCRIPLVSGPAPALSPENSPKLVTVFETNDSFALTLAKASLEEARIDYVVSGYDPRHIVGHPEVAECSVFSLVGHGSSSIQVSPESESEARELLEPLNHPDPAGLEADPEQDENEPQE